MKRLVLIAALLAAGPAAAQGPVSFTAAQADHGHDVYQDKCAQCHGSDLENAQFAPSLKGARFRREWSPRTVGELYAYASANMPPGSAGTLDPEDYAAVLAYLMKGNGAPEGLAFPADAKSAAPLIFPKP